MRYLQNSTLPRAEKNDEISHSSKTAIISTAKKILQRNFSSDFALSKKHQLNELKQCQSQQQWEIQPMNRAQNQLRSHRTTQFNCIRHGKRANEKFCGTRSPNLDKLFLALETIQPLRVLNKNSQPNVESYVELVGVFKIIFP
jgi:hypothetical protein